MISVRIDDKGVNDLLNRLSARLNNRQPLMRQIAEDMKDSVEENFEQEGRPPWKKSKKKDGKTLQLTGKLAKVSATANNDRAIVGSNLPYAAAQHFGIDRTVSVRAFNRRVKARDTYAKGARGGKGKRISSGIGSVKAHSMHMILPARPFMKLQDGDIEGIKKRIMNYLAKT